MIKFDTHLDMIATMMEADADRFASCVDYVNDIAKDLVADGVSGEWVVFSAQCRVCNAREIAIVPAAADVDNLECENCHCMAVQERDIPEWEIKT